MTGRFGLRATPGGFGTPAFGDPLEVLRLSGTTLVREVGGDVTTMRVTGTSLRALALFVGADLGADFSVGADTPPLGDADAPIGLDTGTVEELACCFSLGSAVLDSYVGEVAAATTVQLWPEHFDVGTTVTLGDGQRANVGFSAGDGFESEPYAYFGPWDPGRPGDPSYWNAPFGAVLRSDDIRNAENPAGLAVDFLRRGARLLGTG